MKTEAIRQAAERLRASGHFGLASQVEEELTALEELPTGLVRALLEQGETRDGRWHTRECWAAGRGCIMECQSATWNLRKAGTL